MKLSTFINERMEDILAEWESFARGLVPAAQGMTDSDLRDHAKQILEAVAEDMEVEQTPAEQSRKSRGLAKRLEGMEKSAAITHGELRQANSFSLLQLNAEYRALRASVLRLWLPHAVPSDGALQQVVRFNEAIDQAQTESIEVFSRLTTRTRDLFLAILGHDLRAPLANIVAIAELLQHPPFEASRLLALGARVGRSGNLMTSMVDDLTDYTRTLLGSGMRISREQVDLREICAASIENAGALHPGSCFSYVGEDSSDLRGLFDGVLVRRLTTNLLVNAAQHGEKGRPVTVDARRQGEAMIIRVSNHGPAIPEAALKSIFKPLVQVPLGAGVPSRTSMGLGLFVAREIAAAHGGEISVISNADETAFTVHLPAIPPTT